MSPEQVRPAVECTVSPSRCPLCGGGLFEARGDYRCVRCHFVACAGCGGDVADADGTDEEPS